MQPRRRLEVPPVKSACLACRASKARCNGETPCNRCNANGRACQYLPSRRGRIARAPTTPPSTGNALGSPSSIESVSCDFPNKRTRSFAGLEEAWKPNVPIIIRTCSSSAELLDSYYFLIHPQFPILPSSPTGLLDGGHVRPAISNSMECHESPLYHAISAFISQIPKRANHQSITIQERVARRDHAEQCCSSALAGIDRDMDATEPLTRSRFHPTVPVRLESTIANFLVAVYEYNYRGLMMRARTRMASVIAMAIDLGMHDSSHEIETYLECKQRIWAMILFFANKLSIIHHLPPLTAIVDTRPKTPGSRLRMTFEPWEPIIGAQDILLTSQAQSPTSKELESLDITLSSYLQDLDRPLTHCVTDNIEDLATHNWWSIARIVVHSARIKLHRVTAFSDLPAFVNKHCDMTALQEAKHFPLPTVNCHELPSPESLADSPGSDDWPATDTADSRSAQRSADICLKSAFVVLRMFRYLTEVLPDKHLQLFVVNEADDEDKQAIKASLPLIMPLMACSAMQACYVMVMTLYKVKSTLVAGPISPDPSFLETERLVEELRHGVRDSLSMLGKYSTEFAHIRAMYEELKLVNQVAFVDV